MAHRDRVGIVAALWLSLLTACSGRAPEPKSGFKTGGAVNHVGQLRVYRSGEVTFNGKPVSNATLREQLVALKQHGGAVVWYWREDPGSEMSPQVRSAAKEALAEVIASRLPIAMSTRPDFSDHVDGHGRLQPRPPSSSQ
jgi:hypothetical protein